MKWGAFEIFLSNNFDEIDNKAKENLMEKLVRFRYEQNHKGQVIDRIY